MRCSATFISPYLLGSDCYGSSMSSFSSIFNVKYNINRDSSCGFWGGFGLGIGQAVGSIIGGVIGALSGAGSWLGGSGGGCSCSCDGMGSTGGNSNLGSSGLFSNMWGNTNFSSGTPSSVSTESNATETKSETTEDEPEKTNIDTAKLERYEKEVKSLENASDDDKKSASWKCRVDAYYDIIKKAKKDSDDIDKDADNEKYDALIKRLETLEAGKTEEPEVEEDDPEDENDDENPVTTDNTGGSAGAGNVGERDSKNNYIVSQEIKAQGFRGTYCKDIVYKASEKSFYRLKADGKVGDKVTAPGGFVIYHVNSGGTFMAKRNLSDGSIQKAILSHNGRLVKASIYDKNDKNIANSKYEYKDGKCIETRTIKKSDGKEQTDCYELQSDGKTWQKI